jgi:glycosyltransferase involved in cell wall biosynthesis
LSITLIGHDEAGHLERLLPTLGWADEVVYVDCGSHDGSAELAARLGARVFLRHNDPNLNVNKAHAVAQVTGDWVLYLDPDERVGPELAAEIRATIAAEPPQAAFELPRRNFYLGRWLRHGSQYPDRQLRLFRRGRAQFPCRHVHERLQVEGDIGRLRRPFDHHPYESLEQLVAKFNFYTTVEARHLLERGETGWGVGLRCCLLTPAARFARRWLLKGGCLDGLPGLLAALADSASWPARFLKARDLLRQERAARP